MLPVPKHSTTRLAFAAVLLFFVAACATIREDYPGTPSHAFDRPEETTLGRAHARAQASHPGDSGFRLVNSGTNALLTRAALIDLAEHTIDVQSYIYDADDVGSFLLERLLAAADRGVRVRILLDDQELGLDDDLLALLDAHPNIEVRAFNPFPERSRWSRPLQLVVQLERLGKRMHNKVFAVDSQAAILGGRNISNRYFEGEGDSNFRDFDVVAIGPVVKQVVSHFDMYWNSTIAVPVAAYPVRASERGLHARLKELHRQAQAGMGPQAEYERRKTQFAERMLTKAEEDFIWAKGTAVAEAPIRQQPGAEKAPSALGKALAGVRQSTSREMTVATAYFVPGPRGVEVLSELVRKGVRVRILTNSLASTDVLPVHSGYARYREALLEAGVELHEYRVEASRPTPASQILRAGRSRSALHAKAVVYDRKMTWVGSANLDPRSRRLNTEDGFLIESEAFAKRVLDTMERDFSPENSWRVTLETDAQSGRKRLYWSGIRDGQMVRLDSEPDAGVLRKLGVFIYAAVPEELL